MKHGVPKVIYLQVCDDPDCDVPYDDHDGITWCSHRIDKTDVKYVLAKDKPKRTWVGLTLDEIEWCFDDAEDDKVLAVINIERMLREKNSGSKVF